MILKELENIDSPEERKAFIIENKEDILKAKKREIKWADPVYFPATISKESANKVEAYKSSIFEIVGNSAGFMDSHMDVSIRGSYDKTVQEAAKYAPFLENHNHTPKGIIGKNLGVEVRTMPIKQLGYEAEGTTEALVFKVDPCYDAKMKMLYEEGEIKQHSIGLKYVKIEMCVNDQKDEKGYAMWEKYYPEVINKEQADEAGYFFAVLEQKVFEVSAVLFGSNSYTPPLNKINSLNKEEPHSTLNTIEPSFVIEGFNNTFKLN